jgi:hypothetical protein
MAVQIPITLGQDLPGKCLSADQTTPHVGDGRDGTILDEEAASNKSLRWNQACESKRIHCHRNCHVAYTTDRCDLHHEMAPWRKSIRDPDRSRVWDGLGETESENRRPNRKEFMTIPYVHGIIKGTRSQKMGCHKMYRPDNGPWFKALFEIYTLSVNCHQLRGIRIINQDIYRYPASRSKQTSPQSGWIVCVKLVILRHRSSPFLLNQHVV